MTLRKGRRQVLLALLDLLLLLLGTHMGEADPLENEQKMKLTRGKMEEVFKREQLVWERMDDKVDLLNLVDDRKEEKLFPISVKPPLDLISYKLKSSSVQSALAQINGNLSVYLANMCQNYLGNQEESSVHLSSLRRMNDSHMITRRWITAPLLIGSAIGLVLSVAIWARNFLVGDLEERIEGLEEEAMLSRERHEQMLKEIEEAMLKRMEQEKQADLIREGIRAGVQIIREVLQGNAIHWMAHHHSIYQMMNISLSAGMEKRLALHRQLLPLMIASGKAQLRSCDIPCLTINVSVFFAKRITRVRPLYEIAHKGVVDPESGTFSRIQLPRFVSAHLDKHGALTWERVALWDCEKTGPLYVCPDRAIGQGDQQCGMSNFTGCELHKVAMGQGVFAEGVPFGYGYLVVTNAKMIEYRDVNRSRVLRTRPVTSTFFTLDVPSGEVAKIGEWYFDSRLYVMPSIPQNSSSATGDDHNFTTSGSAIFSLIRARLRSDHPLGPSRPSWSSFSPLELSLLSLLGLLALSAALFCWCRCRHRAPRGPPLSITNLFSSPWGHSSAPNPATASASVPSVPTPPVLFPAPPPHIYIPPPPVPPPPSFCYPMLSGAHPSISLPGTDLRKKEPTAPKFEDGD